MDLLQNITMETESPYLSTDAGTSHSTMNYTMTTEAGSTMSTMNYSTSTEPYDPCKPASSGDIYPEYVGFLTAGVAILFYGTNFAPVKKFDTGDGKLSQHLT